MPSLYWARKLACSASDSGISQVLEADEEARWLVQGDPEPLPVEDVAVAEAVRPCVALHRVAVTDGEGDVGHEHEHGVLPVRRGGGNVGLELLRDLSPLRRGVTGAVDEPDGPERASAASELRLKVTAAMGPPAG